MRRLTLIPPVCILLALLVAVYLCFLTADLFLLLLNLPVPGLLAFCIVHLKHITPIRTRLSGMFWAVSALSSVGIGPLCLPPPP